MVVADALAKAPINSKQWWREQFHQSLKVFIAEQRGELRAQADAKIQKILLDFMKRSKGVWGGFKSLSQEPIIEPAMIPESSSQWAFPVIDGELLQWWIPGPKGFQKGNLSVQEPVAQGAQLVKLNDMTGVIIPALGFDRDGYRLGRGKGFYDRSLAGYKGIKIGVAYSCQLVEKLPAEPHDVQMDLVISEKGLFKPSSKI